MPPRVTHEFQIRGSIVVSISACHAEDPGSIPGRGVFKVTCRCADTQMQSEQNLTCVVHKARVDGAAWKRAEPCTGVIKSRSG